MATPRKRKADRPPPNFIEFVDQQLITAMQKVGDDVFSGAFKDAHAYGMQVGLFNGMKEARDIIAKSYKQWLEDKDAD